MTNIPGATVTPIPGGHAISGLPPIGQQRSRLEDDETQPREPMAVDHTGLIQFGDGWGIDEDMQPELVGFVERCLDRYTGEAEWDRAFAPLDHVDEAIWADLMAPPTKDELMKTVDELFEQGGMGITLIVKGGGEWMRSFLDLIVACFRDQTLPSTRPEQPVFDGGIGTGMGEALTDMIMSILTNRVLAVLRRHGDVLRGAKQLTAARQRCKVTDDVLHIVAARSCAPSISGEEPINGDWGHFMNQAQLQLNAPHHFLARAMRRVKLPPAFLEFVLEALLPEVDPEAAHTKVGVPLDEFTMDVLWPIFYDAGLCEVLALAEEVVAARAANARGGKKAVNAANVETEIHASSSSDSQVSAPDGLGQYADGPEVDSNLHGFVSRFLERYTDASEWDRAFAPLEHVDKRIWANLMGMPTMDEFNTATMVGVARGDTGALFMLSAGIMVKQTTCITIGQMMSSYVLPAGRRVGTFDYSNLGGMLGEAFHSLYSAILRERIAAVLCEHKVLRGTTDLAAARESSAVTDTVLRVVAQHAQSPAAGLWRSFNNSKPPPSPQLLKRAMHRVKLPPKFIDFYFNKLLPSIATEPISPGSRPPVDWVGEELWTMLYDAGLCEILALADEVVAARGQV
ncbi:hypothetical protein H9P43_009276 [Blastocladiella emersonii ATCC 22665]|nr:hypothetical protein H9P43_009276 [Blastocladiella emersonii ATCC 22665]